MHLRRVEMHSVMDVAESFREMPGEKPSPKSDYCTRQFDPDSAVDRYFERRYAFAKRASQYLAKRNVMHVVQIGLWEQSTNGEKPNGKVR